MHYFCLKSLCITLNEVTIYVRLFPYLGHATHASHTAHALIASCHALCTQVSHFSLHTFQLGARSCCSQSWLHRHLTRPGTACRLALELILFTGCCHITRASFDPLAQPRRHCGYVSRRSASLPLARLDHALVCVRRQVVCATFSVIVNILWPLGARRWRWSWRWRHRWTRSRAAACGMW